VTERERLILIARARQKQGQAAAPQTNLPEQIGTGASEGIANMLGAPVNAVTGMWNRRVEDVRQSAREHGKPEPALGPIKYPLGGSANVKDALDPFMSDVDPQTVGQRIGRRAGQDVGAGAVAGPLAGISSPLALGVSTAADAASGVAGGLTSEVTDNPAINAIISILAGGGVAGGAYAARKGPQAPTVPELKSKAGRLYDQVDASDFRLSREQLQEMQGNVSARMYEEGMDPPLDARAARGVNRVYEIGNRTPEGTPSLSEVEDARRYISRKVVPSAEPDEKALGLAQKDEIDKYIKSLATEPDAADDVKALVEARETTRRYKGAEALDKTFDSAELRAASTGVGGNDINAIRQNVRKILESKTESARYTAAEKAEMRSIIDGKGGTNTARWVGGFAPQRGMLPGAAALGQATAVGATGNVLFAAPATIGMVAQIIGEQLTKRQVANLSAMIRNGGPVAAKTMTEGERAVLNALLAAQAAQQGPQ
jgi:hypothetical protein